MSLSPTLDTLAVDVGPFTANGAVPSSALGSMTEFVLFQSSIPFVIPSSGTMGNNGALSSLSPGLPRTISACYMYFAVNVIASGVAAGWYYTVMSSTTAGTVYNNAYTSGQPSIPASPTAFATTGPGAYTGVATSQAAMQYSLPALTMGFRDTLRITEKYSWTSSTNTKTFSTTFGGSTAQSFTNATSGNTSAIVLLDISAQDATNAQVCGNSGSSTGATSSNFAFLTIDTTAAQTLAFNIQHNTAAEFVILESVLIELLRGS